MGLGGAGDSEGGDGEDDQAGLDALRHVCISLKTTKSIRISIRSRPGRGVIHSHRLYHKETGSGDGRLAARIVVSYDQLLTQRLIF